MKNSRRTLSALKRFKRTQIRGDMKRIRIPKRSRVQVVGMDGVFLNNDTVWEGSTRIVTVYSLDDYELYFVNPVDIIQIKDEDSEDN